MLSSEKGVVKGSDFYFFSSSAISKEIFIYLFACGEFHCNTQYIVKRDDYNNFMLVYVKSGVFGVETGNNTFEAKEGDVVILDCHKPHSYYAIKPVEFLWMHFDGKIVKDFFLAITKHDY